MTQDVVARKQVSDTSKVSDTFSITFCVNTHIDYAYQLFTNLPVLRWDNKEEFPQLSTYPHHYHDADGHVTDSPLTGKPEYDIVTVLQAVTQSLSTSGVRWRETFGTISYLGER